MNIRSCGFVLSAAIMIIILAACDLNEHVAWSHFEKIDSDGWDPADRIEFIAQPADSLAALKEQYAGKMIIRYSGRRAIAPFHVVVETENDNGPISCDTILVRLFKDSGHPVGKGNYGVYETEYSITPSQRISDGYSVTLYPLARKESTMGLLNAGVIFTKK